MLKGLAGALAGGLVGAAAWAAIGYFSNYEIGLIAVLVGVLAGTGMKIGAGGDTGPATGGVAVAVALGAILLGKFGVVHFIVAKTAVVPQVTIEVLKGFMYDVHAHAHLDNGEKLNWPAGKDIETAKSRADYPPEIVAEVDTEWDSVPAAEHDAEIRTKQAEVNQRFSAMKWSVEQKAFLHSFGIFDALWAFLAVRAAYGIGSGRNAQ